MQAISEEEDGEDGTSQYEGEGEYTQSRMRGRGMESSAYEGEDYGEESSM